MGHIGEQEEIFKDSYDKEGVSRAVKARDGDRRLPKQRTHAQRERHRKLAEENPHLRIEGDSSSDVDETREHNIRYEDDLDAVKLQETFTGAIGGGRDREITRRNIA